MFVVPGNHTSDIFQALITCHQAGPGAFSTAAARFTIIRPTVTTYRYDELGRVKEIINVGNDTVNYEYDDADNRIEKRIVIE